MGTPHDYSEVEPTKPLFRSSLVRPPLHTPPPTTYGGVGACQEALWSVGVDRNTSAWLMPWSVRLATVGVVSQPGLGETGFAIELTVVVPVPDWVRPSFCSLGEAETLSGAVGCATWCARLALRALADSQAQRSAAGDGNVSPSPLLSPRQLDILRLMEEGFTNARIASEILYSESTVRMESMAIYRSLGVHSRQEAVRTARQLGLLRDPHDT